MKSMQNNMIANTNITTPPQANMQNKHPSVQVCHAISGENLVVDRPTYESNGGLFLQLLRQKVVHKWHGIDVEDLIFISDNGLMLDEYSGGEVSWDEFHFEFFKKIEKEKLSLLEEEEEEGENLLKNDNGKVLFFSFFSNRQFFF